MAQVNFRMDDCLKAQADAEFRQMGLTFSAAITLLCTQVVMKHRLPFAIEAAGALAAPSAMGSTKDLRFKALPSAKSQKGRAATLGERFRDFVHEHPIDVPADFQWSRTEASERKMRCLT